MGQKRIFGEQRCAQLHPALSTCQPGTVGQLLPILGYRALEPSEQRQVLDPNQCFPGGKR